MTRKSVDLYETALTALNWERRYFSEPYMDAILLLHEDCGEILKPDMVCRHCGVEVRGEDVEYREGPGAGTDRRAIKVRRRSTKSIKDSVSARPSYKNLIHVIGDRWTANLIGLAFHGIKRFDDFHTALPIATNVLAGRLKFLLAEDIFTTEPYSTKPLRFDYILTERGRDLFPFFLALLQWGDRWCGDGSGPPTIPMHKPCGHRLRGKVRCSACERQALAHRVRLRTPDASNRSRIRARER